MKQPCLIISIVAFFVTHVCGQATLLEPTEPAAWTAEQIEHINLAAWTDLFEDTTGTIGPEAVLKRGFVKMPLKNWMAKSGDYVRSRIWLRFSINNTSGTDTLRLVFFPGMHARITLYEIQGNTVQLKALGGIFAIKPRFDWQANPNCLPLEVPPGSCLTYLVSIGNLAKLYDQVRTELFTPDAYKSYCRDYQERQLPITLFLTFIIGSLTMLALFGLMQFLLTRGPAYLWYAMFAMANCLNFVRLLEMYTDLRWVSSLIPSFHCYTSLPAISFFYLLFIRYFLDFHLQNGVRSKITKWAIWVFGGVFLSTLVTSALYFSGREISNETAEIFNIFHILLLFPAILVLYLAFTAKSGLSRFVTIGTLLLIFASIDALSSAIFPMTPMHERSPFARGLWPFGTAILLESLCFALGLGYKTKMLEIEKRLAIEEQLRDRQRIARDLHDEVGSTLSSISILSESARTSVQKDLNEARFDNIGDKARAALDSISDIVWSVNPENDSMEKALARMSTYASEMLENVGAELRFEVGEGVESLTLPMEKRKDFYLIFKEAIHNCAKYAQAKHVEVALWKEDNALIMTVKDSGVGFRVEQSASGDFKKLPNLGGNGLRNMRSRAAALGGELHITSSPGVGAEVRLTLPL